MAAAAQLNLFMDTKRPPALRKADFLSPFRYAGGKGWFAPYALRWLATRHSTLTEFVEPFAGGASVGLYVAATGLANHVSLYEIDERIAAVWQTIICDNGGAAWLVRELLGFEFSEAAALEVLTRENLGTRELAFQVIMYNPLSFGGNMAGGLSKLGRSGYHGGGWPSLWNIAGVCERILAVSALRERLSFDHADALDVLLQLPTSTVAFCDPPYTVGRQPGKRLYRHSELDHARLFDIVAYLPNAIMTYHDDAEVRNLAAQHGMQVVAVAMRGNRHQQIQELVIGHDLAWL